MTHPLTTPQSFKNGNRFTIKFGFDENGVRRDFGQNGNPDPFDIWLLTPEEVESLPGGTTITNIFGDTKVVGQDFLELDTRYGYTAHGLLEDQFEH